MDPHVLKAIVVNALKSFIDETIPAVETSVSQLTRFDELQTALTHLRSLNTLITDPSNFDGVLNQEATASLDLERGRLRRRIVRLRARLGYLNDLILRHNHALNMEFIARHLETVSRDTNPTSVVGAPVVGDNV
ncbi:hypothetical protein N665_1018s0017 [Sinapis alba]|nr:hypothetical protein N665_1018s0017 [Sinapis alba]